MTGRRVVPLGLIAVLLPAAGCGVFGTELAETREALAKAQSELIDARAGFAVKQAELEDARAEWRKLVRELAAVRAAAATDRTGFEHKVHKAQAEADKARAQRKAETAELQTAIDRLRASAAFLKRKWQAAEANIARLAKENAELRKPTTRPQK